MMHQVVQMITVLFFQGERATGYGVALLTLLFGSGSSNALLQTLARDIEAVDKTFDVSESKKQRTEQPLVVSCLFVTSFMLSSDLVLVFTQSSVYCRQYYCVSSFTSCTSDNLLSLLLNRRLFLCLNKYVILETLCASIICFLIKVNVNLLSGYHDCHHNT